MAKWDGKTRGNVLGYRIFVLTIKFLGLKGAYFILNFVAFYFYLFMGEKKKVLHNFYLNHVGISEERIQSTIRKNFILIGHSIIDKIAFLIGKGNKISYSEEGEDGLRELAINKQGAFLISGHVGNWDIAGSLLKELDAGVSVVMYQNEQEKIQAFLEAEGSVPQFNIIPVSEDFSHLIEIYKAIKRGDLVCMHADRYFPDSRIVSLDFLGGKAKFPKGPFELIEKMKVPYSFVFAVKKHKFEYAFSATKPVLPSKDAMGIALDFVEVFEEKVKAYPEQWFNYYNFYD